MLEGITFFFDHWTGKQPAKKSASTIFGALDFRNRFCGKYLPFFPDVCWWRYYYYLSAETVIIICTHEVQCVKKVGLREIVCGFNPEKHEIASKSFVKMHLFISENEDRLVHLVSVSEVELKVFVKKVWIIFFKISALTQNCLINDE